MTQTAREIVRLENISKVFGSLTALDDVSVTLRAGEIHALVGENGAGKSTLMNVLYGLLTPTSGRIVVGGEDVTANWNTREAIAHRIGMIHQHFSLVGAHSVLDNIVMPTLKWTDFAPDWNGHRARLAELSETFGFDLPIEKLVDELPVGQRQQVEILKMLYEDAKVLILDEPTAVLTPQQADRLLEMLVKFRDMGYAVVIITHKLEHALELADEISVLRLGRKVAEVRKGDGTISDIARMMVAQDYVPATTRLSTPGKTPIAELSGLTIETDGVRTLDNISLEIRQGEVLGVAGVAGNGQNELADALLGLRPLSEGRIVVGGEDITRHSIGARRKHGLAIVPEDRHERAMVGDLDLAQNMILGYEGEAKFSRYGILREREIQEYCRGCMSEFDVRAPGPETKIGSLSGGNQQKAVIARELSAGPKLIVAHEPSRGLDFAATAYVRGRLVQSAEDGAGVLLLSSDLDELMELSNRVVVMFSGRIVGEIQSGDYSPERFGRLMAGLDAKVDGDTLQDA
ncbi:ABC transporter ATP-binding protein [Oceanibium sediminis]|uniref:ABC transporter ATP-binding protein n=1 Tax=Oceanibium sediminis TaxID=2026339 RepID=UPI000DD2EB36|nr:ABC transporter ATP-binding protein [Oceanibium sediminis]